MKQFRMTAIAVAAAQIALLAGAASAQTSTTQKNENGTNVVVVSGQRASLQSAQQLKKDADEIVDSIVAEDIGKLPDNSVSEVLQRIAGVTMERTLMGDPNHFFVEGTGVAVRGLPYVASTLNGRASFSSNGGRSLSFEDVPPELVAGVDVYKNPSAEINEGGISGVVNLRTFMPFDFAGFKAAASVKEEYSDLRKGKPSPSGSALLSNRWKTPFGDVGVLLDVSKSKATQRTDNIQIDPYYRRTDVIPGQVAWVPRSAEWRRTDFDRSRNGQYGALQWKPTKDITAGLTFFRSNYKMTWHEHAVVDQEPFPYDVKVANGVFDANNVFQSGTLSNPNHDGGTNFKPGGLNLTGDGRVADSESTTIDKAFNLRWRLSQSWTMQVDAQRTRSSSWRTDSTISTGFFVPSQSIDLTGDMPKLGFTQTDIARLGQDSNYYWASMMIHKDQGDAGARSLKVDLKYDFDDPILRDVRFGVRSSHRDATTYNTTPSSYYWAAVTAPWQLGYNVSQLAQLSDPRFKQAETLETYNNFFGGKFNVPGVIYAGESLLRAYPDSYTTLDSYHYMLCKEQVAAQKWGSCANWVPAGFITDPASGNKQSEKNNAAYAQLRFGFDNLAFPIDGTLGLRYAKVDGHADGYMSFKPTAISLPTGGRLTGAAYPTFAPFATPMSFENPYHNWLPTLNLRMKASDTLQFRVALGKAIAQPNYSQMQGYSTLSEKPINAVTDTKAGTVHIDGVSLTGSAAGNPMLQPVKSNQADFSAEWYPAPGSSITFAAFYKQLKNMIVNQTSYYKLNDVNGQPYNFTMTTPINGAHGRVRGFELGGQTYFDKLPWFSSLPSWAQGFGVQGNFTLTSNSRDLDTPVPPTNCHGGLGGGADNLNLSLNGCDTDGRSFSGLPMIGVSRRMANFALLYDSGPLSARLAWNWRGRYMQDVKTTGTTGPDGTDTDPSSPTFNAKTVSYGLPIWSESYTQVDGSIFYKINGQWTLGMDFRNLTNAKYRQTMQQHIGNMPHTWWTSGRQYAAQLRYTY